MAADLWEEYDLADDDDADIAPKSPDIDPSWWRVYVASFKLANRRWPTTSELLAAWEARD
ncbi:Hypothetical protein PFR_JS13-2_780 [Propionibacterium freudenreichii]|nr:Hypothetical protein PFR_JS11_791 [Propionibacterium freudenreichii]SBN95170.1 Hypothetical protein PFR_JS12-2_786 [Propionibacterium freudenreichii]SCC96756.1 Hypothetical protein PFR_JS12-1_788 [Propionibacterium freudenreichii]SCQ48153.1 Hypothetical protein PFR_JS13-1_791 [Propionibacterium freudenreichii]SCQ52445.1 Hypothetical protein PFR_JS13-2_780 [Propionibacterium freudenreichii]